MGMASGYAEMRAAEVVGNEPKTPNTNVLRLRFLDSKGFTYRPGQFNLLYVFGVGEAAISVSGWDGEILEHTVKAVGYITRALLRLRPGDRIGVRGPYGTWWPLEEAEGKEVVVVAGGVGLPPLRPSIHHMLRRRDRYPSVKILYGARTPRDLLFTEEYEEWSRGAEVLVTVDWPDERWTGHVGVVTTLFAKTTIDPRRIIAFVCGPEIMMKFTVLELLKRGVDPASVFLSMERRMKCGIGLCGHCQFGPYFVCCDGPIFPYSKVMPIFGMEEI